MLQLDYRLRYLLLRACSVITFTLVCADGVDRGSASSRWVCVVSCQDMKLTVDTRQMRREARSMRPTVNRIAASELNQAALDIARETFNTLPPDIGDIQSQRSKIKAYLNAIVLQRVRIAKSGKRKGKFIKQGRKSAQLQRVNLIVQARQARSGKRGLYGAEMKKIAGAFSRRAQISVGYLKVVFLPVIRTLNSFVKYKMPFSETGGTNRISIWPGSKGYGFAKIATNGSLNALLNLRWNLKGPRAGYARGLIERAFGAAWRVRILRMQVRLAKTFQQNFSR